MAAKKEAARVKQMLEQYRGEVPTAPCRSFWLPLLTPDAGRPRGALFQERDKRFALDMANLDRPGTASAADTSMTPKPVAAGEHARSRAATMSAPPRSSQAREPTALEGATAMEARVVSMIAHSRTGRGRCRHFNGAAVQEHHQQAARGAGE